MATASSPLERLAAVGAGALLFFLKRPDSPPATPDTEKTATNADASARWGEEQKYSGGEDRRIHFGGAPQV